MKAEAVQALEQGDIDKALGLWSRITGGNADAADLLEHATLLQQLYRSAEASLCWDRLLAHPATTAGQLLAAGKQWFQLGRFAGCARFTARAMDLDPGSPDTAAMHASALERSGDKEQAERVILAALEEHPHHARLVRLMAHIRRRDGGFEEARDMLEKQLREASSDDDWRLRYELAAVLDRTGDSGGAMRALELAKRQLEPAAERIRPVWRVMAQRQWEVTLALSSERLVRWQRNANVEAASPCFMAGFPRSGTTLLERVITAHPETIGTDESGVLATQFRDPIVFGSTSAEEVIAELDGYDESDLSSGRAEYFRCTADVLGEDPGTRLLIEKDPLLTADCGIL